MAVKRISLQQLQAEEEGPADGKPTEAREPRGHPTSERLRIVSHGERMEVASDMLHGEHYRRRHQGERIPSHVGELSGRGIQRQVQTARKLRFHAARGDEAAIYLLSDRYARERAITSGRLDQALREAREAAAQRAARARDHE